MRGNSGTVRVLYHRPACIIRRAEQSGMLPPRPPSPPPDRCRRIREALEYRVNLSRDGGIGGTGQRARGKRGARCEQTPERGAARMHARLARGSILQTRSLAPALAQHPARPCPTSCSTAQTRRHRAESTMTNR